MLNSDRALVIGKKKVKTKKRSNLNSGSHGELGQNTGDWPHEKKLGATNFGILLLRRNRLRI